MNARARLKIAILDDHQNVALNSADGEQASRRTAQQ
jgi:hypothetical protein